MGLKKLAVLYAGAGYREKMKQRLKKDEALASTSGQPLFGLDRAALGELIASWGEPQFRVRQLAEAIYRQWVTEISAITPFSLDLRRRIAEAGFSVGRPTIQQSFSSSDGTERYLVGCADGRTVETVWMPEGDGGEISAFEGEEESESERQRATICVSSQVGCAVGCRFCLTARLGLERSLTPGEIAGQVVAVLERHAVELGRDRVNLVFMGMGEPFLNYENFSAAVRILVEEVGVSPRRMTVSTSGIVPGIAQLAAEPPELRPKLALSLNAPSNAIRDELMPINRRWPLEEVFAAIRKIQLRAHERITFEYVLLGGLTDRPEQSREVARLARRSGLPVKINLIAWNQGPGIEYRAPAPASVEAFRQILVAEGLPAYLRRPRGRDIYAACGQLKRTVEG